MDYLSDKVNSITGVALSNINELRRKRKQAESGGVSSATTDGPNNDNNDATSERIQAQTSAMQITNPKIAPPKRRAMHLALLGGGTPFGGDTSESDAFRRHLSTPPPPIGFNLSLAGAQTDSIGSKELKLADRQPELPVPSDNDNKPAQVVGPTTTTTTTTTTPHLQQRRPELESSESLYEGDAWTRLWFQRVMILSFIRLLLFIRKVYEDYHATKLYNLTGETGHFLISAATLFMPTIVFTIYRVSRYLQVILPPLRAIKSLNSETGNSTSSDKDAQTTTRKSPKATSSSSAGGGGAAAASDDDDDKQLRRALMNSPTSMESSLSQPTAGADDGLVTARQSPSNLDEFVDSNATSGSEAPVVKTEGERIGASAVGEVAVQTGNVHKQQQQTQTESVNVDKLGNLPDRETTRVVIGASEQILHGILFIFWQLKRQVDVMGYLVERACLWRKPSEGEKEQINRLRLGSDGLEWFQDFYAAFLAILAQVYTLGLHWASNDTQITPLRAATTTNTAAGALLDSASLSDSSAISNTARAISQTLGQQIASGDALIGKDLLLTSQLLVSSAVVFSLLIAVKRRDDGPLTLGLSMLGWGSIFAARIMVIALAFVHIGWQIMLSLVACHVLGITGWIYKIALGSHNLHADENESLKWEQDQAQIDDVELAPVEPGANEPSEAEQEPAPSKPALSYAITNNWSIAEHLVLIAQIMALFALPSLFYWPIMFNLKLHYRPFKYLVLILSENFILIPVIWFKISSTTSVGQWYLLGTIGGLSIVGFIFVSLYVSCKPSLTEYFARADELFNEADRCGIYFEFCSRVFRMPDLTKHDFKRLLNQTEQVEEC